MKIIFIGTAKFAVPSLQNLLKNKNCQVQAVITQPDRPAGRGLELQKSPIKKFIRRSEPMCSPLLLGRHTNLPLQGDGWIQGLPPQIIQPKKIIEIKEQIKKLNPDLLVVCAYGEILPQEILIIPRLGAINIHASLLPKYRGASPIQAAILNGDKYTGATIIQMDEKLDHGPIISQARLKIMANETGGSLYDKLAKLGSVLLEFTLDKIIQNAKFKMQNCNLKFKIDKGIVEKKIAFYDPPEAQNGKQATYAKKLRSKDGSVRPCLRSATEIEKMVRAYNPWPGTYFEIQNLKFKNLKIYKTKVETTRRIVSTKNNQNLKHKIKLGDLFVWNNQLTLKCYVDYLILQKVQVPGKKIISGQEFVSGYLRQS